jgi:hypothetical protein
MNIVVNVFDELTVLALRLRGSGSEEIPGCSTSNLKQDSVINSS